MFFRKKQKDEFVSELKKHLDEEKVREIVAKIEEIRKKGKLDVWNSSENAGLF